MSKVRVRVEADYPAYALKRKITGEFTEKAKEENEKILNKLLKTFNRQRDDAGINHDLKRYACFESKSRIKRRKKREAIAKRKQEDLCERVLRGEKVPGAAKLLKKLKEDNKKNRGEKNGRA